MRRGSAVYEQPLDAMTGMPQGWKARGTGG